MQKPLMAAYCQEVHKLENKFQGIELHHVPQKNNDAADFLAKLAARRVPTPDGVFINDLHEPSARILECLIQMHPDANQALRGSDPGASMTTSPTTVAVVTLDQADWRASLLAYLLKEVLSPERTEAQQIARRAKTFVAISNELYKRSLSGVLMKCVPGDQGKQLLLEIHVEIYEHHVALRSLVRKAFRQGFY